MWECSGLTNDSVYYLPGFNWTGWTRVYDASSDLQNSPRGWSFVYSIPSSGLGCTGTVTAIEFCYRIPRNIIDNAPAEGYLVFTLSRLRQKGSCFRVRDSIPVNSRPDTIKCSRNRYCCDIMTLHTADRFLLPAENFDFGITTPSPSLPNLQRFKTLYRVEQFRKKISLSTGFLCNFGNAFTDELQTFRFHLSKLLSVP